MCIRDSNLTLAQNENLKNKITKNLRCLVCQGQSVADSNSDFAQTLKMVVKDLIGQEKTEEEIYHFLSEKYGDWILMTPPIKKLTYVLWFAPIIIMSIGLIVIFRRKREKV